MSERDATDEGWVGPTGTPADVARRLASLPDRRMRCARLRDLVLTIDPAAAAWLLDSLATAGRAGGPPFDVGLLAAVDLMMGESLPYEQRREIFLAADARQLQACKELMLTDEQASDPRGARPRPLIPGTRPLTLGERKSLARSWDRRVLERLFLDPHADVVARLLENPHVTETDIVKIATSRRSSAEVLGLVLRSNRWASNRRVRRAVVRNPSLPVATALRLLGLLNLSELREMARDPSLPDALALALHRRLRPPS